ncbi:hypothetical protein FRC08_006031 [Ceratobasidium sp. 394]|nr:hypothetical protein FRC08_006031 [Ceratobasidium sp. 394]KAG9098680.1 hypothetical protein FS749_003247 [Ceratobasidium sp. UAMH 11750]
MCQVSKDVLHGSKTPDQVQWHWKACYGKFVAILRREEHTGGGDGDEVEQDEALDENNDSDVEIMSEGGKKVRIGGDMGAYSGAVLDAFEQTELYTMIYAVAKDSPEVTKPEDFDQTRDFSGSDTGTGSKATTSKSNSSTDDRDLLRQTIETVQASIASFQESRQANIKFAEQREGREKKAEDDRRADAKEDREFKRRKFSLETENALASREVDKRRLDHDERRIRL